MMLATLIVLSLSATVSLGSVLGQCPNPKTFPDFDLEKFSGTWYEIESSMSVDKVSKRCSTFAIDFKGKGKAGLLHKFVSAVTDKSKSEYSEITAKTNDAAKLQISPLKGTVLSRKWTLSIIDTDYDTYAIGYSCRQKLVARFEDVFIFSRTKELTDEQKVKIYDTLKKVNINQKNLMTVDQKHKDCSS